MIKIKDYEILLELNKIEQCLTGCSLEFIKSIAEDYKYHELIENIYIRIWYESSRNFANNLDSLISHIDNKRKNINSSKEFNWKEIACLEGDFGVDINSNDYEKFRLDNIYHKYPSYKFILDATLADWLYMLDYRSSIKNEDFNQFLDFVESIPIIKEFRRGINNLYKDNISAVIKEIER